MFEQWCFLVNLIFAYLGINSNTLFILIHVEIYCRMVNINEFFLDNSGCWVRDRNVNSHIRHSRTI